MILIRVFCQRKARGTAEATHRMGIAVYDQKKVRLRETSVRQNSSTWVTPNSHARYTAKPLEYLSIDEIRHTRRIKGAGDGSQDDTRICGECVRHWNK